MFRFLRRPGRRPPDPDPSAADPYSRASKLGNAGNLFSHTGNHEAAAYIFGELVRAEPEHSLGWYGLAYELYDIFAANGDLDLLCDSLRCARRSLQEDPDNPLVQGLVEAIRTGTPLPRESFDRGEPFQGEVATLLQESGCEPDTLTSAFHTLSAWEHRLQVVMWLDVLDPQIYVPLLVAAAERDSHRDVRMGALKRMPDHSRAPEVRGALERIVSSGEGTTIEPYLSMALQAIREPWAARLYEQIRRR
jgi:hypothetical protein